MNELNRSPGHAIAGWPNRAVDTPQDDSSGIPRQAFVAPPREHRSQREPERVRSLAVFAGLASLTLLGALIGLSREAGPAWDEGILIERAEPAVRWLRSSFHWIHGHDRTRDPKETARIEPSSGIAAHWQYIDQLEGHPAGHAWLVAIARQFDGRLGSILDRTRMVTALLFVAGIVAAQVRLFRWKFGSAAVLLPLLVLGFPRLVGHARLATLDGALCGVWMLCWAAQPRDPNRRLAELVWGMLPGLCCSIKATGLGVFAGALMLARRHPRPTGMLARSLPIAVMTFVVLNPPCWKDPAGRMAEFVSRNAVRREAAGFVVATQFLGQHYADGSQVPAYASWLRIAVMVPVVILISAIIGTVVLWRQRESEAVAILVHTILLPALQMLPGVPAHDDLRLILPSINMAMIPASIGLVYFSRQVLPGQRGGCILVAVIGSLVGRTFWISPALLSDYNILIGGPAGARNAGMESAYYWDAMSPGFQARLIQRQPRSVCLVGYPRENLSLLDKGTQSQHWFTGSANDVADLYVIQNRPAHFDRVSRYLFEASSPILSSTISDPLSSGQRPVELIAVFDRATVVDAIQAVSVQRDESRIEPSRSTSFTKTCAARQDGPG